MISWLRVSLAVWRCVELEPVLATRRGGLLAGVHRERLRSQSPGSAPRQQGLKDGRGAES